jgi:hypothetical protein
MAGDARTQAGARAAGESIDMTARTYHTENDQAHAEGETYAVTDRALAETLRAIGFVSIAGWTDAGSGGGAAPVLATLTPATGLAATAVTVQVTGTGFVAADVVAWNGIAVPTTFVSATELSAAVDAAAVAVPGDVPVTVGASNALTFTVTAAR